MMRKVILIMIALFLSLAGTAQVDERFKKESGKKEDSAEKSRKKSEENRPQQKSDKKESENFWDHLVVGGGAGLSFGNSTQIMLAPQVGYRFNENWVAGAGFIYNYTKINQAYNRQTGNFEDVDYEDQIYGPTFFGTFFPFDNVFTGAEFQVLNHNAVLYNPVNSEFYRENRWSPVLWLQAGYTKPMGDNGYLQLGVRINALHDRSSPYGTYWSPIISFYF